MDDGDVGGSRETGVGETVYVNVGPRAGRLLHSTESCLTGEGVWDKTEGDRTRIEESGGTVEDHA